VLRLVTGAAAGAARSSGFLCVFSESSTFFSAEVTPSPLLSWAKRESRAGGALGMAGEEDADGALRAVCGTAGLLTVLEATLACLGEKVLAS
jgi:hypothetical protein